MLDELHAHFTRFVLPLADLDTATLALWTAHTHLIDKMRTTPRLLITAPLPTRARRRCSTT